MEASESYCNSLNRSIVKAINKTGRAYLTYTDLGKNVAIRVAVGNILITEQHLTEVFELIKHEARSQTIAIEDSELDNERGF